MWNLVTLESVCKPKKVLNLPLWLFQELVEQPSADPVELRHGQRDQIPRDAQTKVSELVLRIID